MRGLCLTPMVVLLLLVGTAQAETQAGGEGFSLRVPPSFEALTADDMQICPVRGVDLTAKIAAPAAETRQVYVAGSILAPDALLLVARIQLNPGALANSRERHRYLLDRLFLSQSHFDQLVEEGEVALRPVEVNGHTALHMSHAGAEGPLGLTEPVTRALLVVADGFLVVVMLQVTDLQAVSVEATWSAVRAAFVMDAPARPVRQALLYGGIGLVGLILLLVMARLVRSGRRGAPVPAGPAPGGLSMSSEGWGGSRPPEGSPSLPVKSIEPEPAGPPPRKGLQSPLSANGRFSQ